jgi:hypothetical protein
MKRKKTTSPRHRIERDQAPPASGPDQPAPIGGEPLAPEPEEPVEAHRDTRAETESEETDIAPDLIDTPPPATRSDSVDGCSTRDDAAQAADLDGSTRD